MGKRLQQIFRELFVPPRKGQRVTADWIKAAKAENLGMKSFEDLEVITKEVGDYDLKTLKQEAVVIETEINGRELY